MKKGVTKQILKILSNILFYVILIIVVIVTLFMIQGKISGDIPSLFGYRLYVVLSGSMEPALHTGSLAIVGKVDASSLSVNDVITYRNLDNGMLITHRIVNINKSDTLSFTTKGDANDTADFSPVKPEDITGKAIFSIPLVGSLMEFARTKEGLLILLIIPGAFIALFEFRKLFKYAILMDRKKQDEKRAKVDKATVECPEDSSQKQ